MANLKLRSTSKADQPQALWGIRRKYWILLVIALVGAFAWGAYAMNNQNTASTTSSQVHDSIKVKKSAPNISDTSSTPDPVQPSTPTSPPATSNTPSPSVQPNATPKPEVSASHPTSADCGPSGSKLTVYASVKTGTHAYKDHPVYRDSSNEVLYDVSYGSAISTAFCDDAKTALFHEVGRQIYARFNFDDVSLNSL